MQGFFSWLSNKKLMRWFNGSKIVNNNGEPMIVYHGTPNNRPFKNFNKGNTISFSTNPSFASWFGKKGVTQSNIVRAYLKVKNPFDYRNPEHRKLMIKWWEENKNPYISQSKTALEQGLFGVIADRKFLQSHGFDGCWTFENNALNIEVLDPNQIWIIDNKPAD